MASNYKTYVLKVTKSLYFIQLCVNVGPLRSAGHLFGPISVGLSRTALCCLIMTASSVIESQGQCLLNLCS